MKNHNVYHRCLCFIFDQTTTAQEQKSLYEQTLLAIKSWIASALVIRRQGKFLTLKVMLNLLLFLITDRRPIISRRNWPIRSITKSIILHHQLMWYNSLWLWRWLPHRLSKSQSLSTTTVLFRTTFTRTIKLNLLLK